MLSTSNRELRYFEKKARLKVKTTEASIFRKHIFHTYRESSIFTTIACTGWKKLDSSVKQATSKQGQWNRNSHWLWATSLSIDRHRLQTHQLVEFVPLLADGVDAFRFPPPACEGAFVIKRLGHAWNFVRYSRGISIFPASVPGFLKDDIKERYSRRITFTGGTYTRYFLSLW